jgi:anti-sigma B factor antagonist
MEDPEQMVCVVSMTVSGATFVIKVLGDLDYRYAATLRQEVDTAFQGPHLSMLIIDMSGMTFCDSSGLAALVYALRRCRAASTHLVVTGTNASLERWMSITGLGRLFDRRTHMADALTC